MQLTGGLYETETPLLRAIHRFAYFQSQGRGSRQKIAWGSGQPARTIPVGPPAHTQLLLQYLFLQCFSPLRQKLPLSMRLHTFGGKVARSDSVPVSDWDMLWCSHSEWSKGSSRAETNTSTEHSPVHTWVGAETAQWCGANLSSPNPATN